MRLPRSARSLAPLLLFAGLVASHSAAQGQQLDPGCSRERYKAERPARGREAAEDSTRHAVRVAVLNDIRASTRAAGVAEPTGLFLLWLDAARRVPRVHLDGSNVPVEVASAVAERSVPLLATWPGRREVHLTLRLDSLPVAEPVHGVVRVLCRPHLTNREFVQQILQRQVTQNREYVARAGNRNVAHLKMLVNRAGQVAYSEIDRSSGDPRIDGMARNVAAAMQFRQGSIDGVPMDLWVVLPIAIAAPRQLPGSSARDW